VTPWDAHSLGPWRGPGGCNDHWPAEGGQFLGLSLQSVDPRWMRFDGSDIGNSKTSGARGGHALETSRPTVHYLASRSLWRLAGCYSDDGSPFVTTALPPRWPFGGSGAAGMTAVRGHRDALRRLGHADPGSPNRPPSRDCQQMNPLIWEHWAPTFPNAPSV
jgi:hypothetical protein